MPGWAQIGKDKPERYYLTVQNDESSATIAAGGLAVFAMDGTDDGHDVVKPTSSTAGKATSFFAGVAVKAIPAGDRGIVQCYGLVQTLSVTQQTRAASTDSFASAPAVAIGDQLVIETVVGNASRSGAGAQSAVPGFLAAIGTLASKASSAASDVASANAADLSLGGSIKAFVRAM